MPRECLVCGRPLLRNEHHLCIWCLTDLPQTWFWSMPRNRMADRLNALIQRDLAHPDIAQPDLTQPDLDKPGLAQPGLAQPGLASTPAPSSPTTASPAAIPPAALPTLSASPIPSALTLTAAQGSTAPSPSSTSAAPTPTIPPADVLTPASSASTTTSSAGSAVPPAQGGFEPYSYAAALFFYDVNAYYRRITQALKYQGDLAAGRYFARMLGERLAGSALFADVDVVIPVPLHPLRRWRRGYNQAEVIAKVVAECLGVPCETGLLVRRRRTRTQTRLSVEEKAANVRTAFALRLPATHPATTAIPPDTSPIPSPPTPCRTQPISGAPASTAVPSSSAESVAKTENAQIRSSRGAVVTLEDQKYPNPVFESTPSHPCESSASTTPASSPSVAPAAVPSVPSSSAGLVAKTENAQIRSSRGAVVTLEDQKYPNPVFESTPSHPCESSASTTPASSPSTAPYRHILLIDDVFTTGATLNACRRTLRTAFPHPTRISVATLGYVGSA